MISFELKSEEDTKSLAEFVGKHVKEGTALALIGNLGAGKTLFSKYVAKTLGAKGEITSPTFNIMNIYEGICPIYHFDLYRLDNITQLEDIGFYEYTESEEGVCLIEWADKFKEELPQNTVEVNFEILGENSRKVMFDGEGEIAEELLKILKGGMVS